MIISLEEHLKLSELSKIFDYQPLHDSEIRKIVTSSKEALQGSLFLALPGKNANGDQFLGEAKMRGAITVSATRDDSDILVDDISRALLKIADLYKDKLKLLRHTIAITGSVGKTTAKNILKKMLDPLYETHATKENYNNYIGCSHTVLTAPKHTEALIIEIGMNHAGEISQISKAITPSLSIITNIGTAHIGNLGSKKAIANAKLEILDGMEKELLIAPYGENLIKKAKNVYTFSTASDKADCFIEPINITKKGSRFNIHTKRFLLENQYTSLVGEHVLNAIAIGVSVLDILELDKDVIFNSLKKINEADLRGRFRSAGDFLVFDDTYSASADALEAVLKRISMEDGIKSAVLGDMLELGEKTKMLHERVGSLVRQNGFSRLFAFGKYAKHYANGAMTSGMDKNSIFINTDIERPDITARDIIANCKAGELLLVKASHNIRADRIIDQLMKK